MKFSEIKSELAPFEALIETIPEDQIQGIKISRILLSKIDELFEELAVKEERISYLTTELFGKNKNKEDPDSEVADEKDQDEDPKKSEKEAKKRVEDAKSPKKNMPKGSAKKQTVRRRVPKGLKCSACHGDVKDIGYGHKASEIDLIKMGVLDREYLLHRGRCSCGEVDFEMPRPERVLEQRIYTSEFISQLIVSKFKFHLSVYRQQKQFLDAGIYVNRNVLNDLVNNAWKELEPVVKRLRQIAREQKYKYCDETPICRVKKGKSKRYYLWCLHTELAVVFELTEKRNQALAKDFIGEGGTVMTDGLGIYSEKSIDGVHGNCLAHCLQKFFRSFSSFSEESDRAIDFMVEVYKVEKEAKAEGLSPEDRLALRQKKSAKHMADFRAFLENLNPPPRSALGKAISYTLERWKEITLFLRDGGIEVDNNRVESIFRDVKLGLKNYLFVMSDLGGEAMAGFYNLIMTCELHGINPQDYLADILVRLANGHPASDIDALLPWSWKADASRLKISSKDEHVEQEYPRELLVKKLGLEGKIYFDDPDETLDDGAHIYEMTALSP
ncbi:IS66 family transposase [Pseudobacteriovorax antillogorgiicola]|uniref:Transposase n=1 Tax=Pseudobacteriovorax antillogorgiicola TaxID=1513793 RepID=A0A1Y6CQY3_9BACT|nr:IS66 family transposase [Pseudobacteriovorax antillogorgiicola]TCS41569.1 transposase [Pseudobacteriovorax antillogorgiicola]SMF83345.1 transposase [Pseudobacteriovorax antillogorgiicola]